MNSGLPYILFVLVVVAGFLFFVFVISDRKRQRTRAGYAPGRGRGSSCATVMIARSAANPAELVSTAVRHVGAFEVSEIDDLIFAAWSRISLLSFYSQKSLPREYGIYFQSSSGDVNAMSVSCCCCLRYAILWRPRTFFGTDSVQEYATELAKELADLVNRSV